jgi:hypothetical protein
MPRPLYSQGKGAHGKHSIGSWVGPKSSLNAIKKGKCYSCWELNHGRPDRSQWLYRLSYVNSPDERTIDPHERYYEEMYYVGD